MPDSGIKAKGIQDGLRTFHSTIKRKCTKKQKQNQNHEYVKRIEDIYEAIPKYPTKTIHNKENKTLLGHYPRYKYTQIHRDEW